MRVLVLVLILLLPALASAQEAPDVVGELTISMARICVNESGFRRPADCAMIWQVARRRGGPTMEGRLAWLRAHSSCVLSDRPMTAFEARGNCRWTRHLDDSDAQPAGWPTAVPWERYVAPWRRIREVIRGWVLGGRPRHGWPCERDPDTWGGSMDRARAEALGLVPVECTGTVNQGYRFPG